jgi:hypothetical protein
MGNNRYSCPHCAKTSFSSWDKAVATSGRPAKCAECDGLSYVSIGFNLSLGLLTEILLLAVALLVFSGQYLLAAALLVGGAIIGYWLDKRLPLRATDKAAVARAKKNSLLVAFCLLAALMVFLQLQGG